MRCITENTKQTLRLGTKIAKYLSGGDVLAISGELGAGKTILIKGIAAGLGVKQVVRSPSFNLMKVYKIMKHVTCNMKHETQIKIFVHLDCYRLKSGAEAIDLGLLDYLGEPRTVVAIEWPEKLKNLLGKRIAKKIRIRSLGKERREFYFSRWPLSPISLKRTFST